MERGWREDSPSLVSMSYINMKIEVILFDDIGIITLELFFLIR